MVVVTTIYRDTTREEPSEISCSQAVRDLAVGRRGCGVLPVHPAALLEVSATEPHF